MHTKNTQNGGQIVRWHEGVKRLGQQVNHRGAPSPIQRYAYAPLLQHSTHIGALKQIHGHMFRTGFNENTNLATKLASMYSACGSVEDARLVFDKMNKRDAFCWNEMMKTYATNGYSAEALRLYRQMHRAGLPPDNFSFPFVLKASADVSALQEGQEIHAHVVRTGFESDVFVGNSLLAMYAKCGSMDSAHQLFDKMSQRDVVSWSTMISSSAQGGGTNEGMTLFHQMLLAGVAPDAVTVASVLPACVGLAALQQGECIHAYAIRSGFDQSIILQIKLVTMYATCGGVENARIIFDKMNIRNVFLWNVMIRGYVNNGLLEEAFTLYCQMHLAGTQPDNFTFPFVLKACADLSALREGEGIHTHIVRTGFDSDVFVGNSLVALYAKCGNMMVACQLFEKMSEKDVVSWSSMIVGYVQSGHVIEALTLFHQMRLADVTPDSVTMVSVLQACAYLAALQQGRTIHAYIINGGFESDVTVRTALVDMYAKCGSIEIAYQVFDKMPERNVVSWSAMISGYGMHGHGEDALALFTQMQQIGMKPDQITFVSVLSACSHAGLVDEGWKYFYCMIQDHFITPSADHYACMVDLLGRSGRLAEAHDFIKNMPLEPGTVVWGALLGACRIHCNIELGERVAECLLGLDFENAGYYVLLSNIYAASGRWDDVAKVRTTMKQRGLKKTPGCSFIEVNSRVHSFLTGDRSHPQSEKIYAMLETLMGQMEEAGYVPSMSFVLHDVEDEEKPHILSSHSEKLAIAFGLINTNAGTPIRITKNLRVCGDCHKAAKFISKIVRREIIMRDANRFHHFKDGLCSCADYW